MPRKPRFNLPGIPQHVIQRGNNRGACFFSTQDYQHYLLSLKTAADKYPCQIHAYVLMTNHVHLLLTPVMEHSVSQVMQSLGRRYVYYVNKKYDRTGTLWEGRFKSSLVDSERYFLTCMRYIELNPVRAGLIDRPQDYPWSSYQTNALGRKDELIRSHPVYKGLAGQSSHRQQAYRALFEHLMDPKTIDKIRAALNHELVLGRSSFKDEIERRTRRQTRLGKAGRPRNNNPVND